MAATRFLALLDESPDGAIGKKAGSMEWRSDGTAVSTQFPFHAPHAMPVSATQAANSSASSDDTQVMELLQRFASAMYVSHELPGGGARMTVALDAAVPGAVAEFVREGAFLRIRLHTRDGLSFRQMTSQQDALSVALGHTTRLQVSVEVVCDREAHDGRAG